ncbi:hypothetical protein UO65_3485 [Actinokineospora spheciospongiae]|uniref:Uncharacterized protein n=1 Tax=Actinokineospora spheciospongiae TaxID=909613 RepID=W7J537_9PSEU|nr:hypothetical protein UO65_3485 [Actinokineospora spheciospongiae]
MDLGVLHARQSLPHGLDAGNLLGCGHQPMLRAGSRGGPRGWHAPQPLSRAPCDDPGAVRNLVTPRAG